MAVILAALFAGAQPPPAAMALTRGHAARAVGDFPRAEACYRAAVTEAAMLPVDDPGAAEPYLALVELYAAWRKPTEMAAALTALTTHLADTAPGAAERLFTLAERVRKQWKYDLAEWLYLVSLDVSARDGKEADPSILPTLDALADLYRVNGYQKEKAEPLWERAIGIAEQAGGIVDARVATYLLALAGLHLGWPERRGRVEAELFRAQTIRERAFGMDDPRVAEVLLPLAGYYQRLDVRRYRDAEALYRRALAIQEGAYGTEDERLVMTLRLLARFYEHEFGDAPAAERLRLRIVAIYEKAFGGGDWRVGDARMAVAALCLEQQRWAEAETHLRKALATRPKVDEPMGWSNVILLSWLGRACHRQRKLTEAAEFYQRAAAVLDRLFVDGHYDPTLIPYVYEDAVTCLHEADEPVEAEALADRAAACARRVWPDGVPRLLFNADWQQTHPDPYGNWKLSAESYYRLALFLQSRKKLPDDPELAEIQRKYAAFLQSIGRGAERMP